MSRAFISYDPGCRDDTAMLIGEIRDGRLVVHHVHLRSDDPDRFIREIGCYERRSPEAS